MYELIFTEVIIVNDLVRHCSSIPTIAEANRGIFNSR